MLLFQAGAQADSRFADINYYSQLSGALPAEKIRQTYEKLCSEYGAIGWYDQLVAPGFFRSMFGAPVQKANDAFTVAKTGKYNPSLPTKVGGERVPQAVEDLYNSKHDFDLSYRALMAAEKKLSAHKDDAACAQEYLFAYAKYVQSLQDLQERVQRFDQSGLKGVVNGINFALDAATLPLLAAGAGEAVMGVRLAVSQGFKAAGTLALKSMPKAALFSAAYAAPQTAGDYFTMKDQQEAVRKFQANAGAATGKLRQEIYALKTMAAKEGMAGAASQLDGLYESLLRLSMDVKGKEVDAGALAKRFAGYFAMGMALSFALSLGGAAGRIAKYGAEGLSGADLKTYLGIAEAIESRDMGRLKAAFGIEGELSIASLRKQYGALMKKYHPDMAEGSGAAPNAKMAQKINEAKKMLELHAKGGEGFAKPEPAKPKELSNERKVEVPQSKGPALLLRRVEAESPAAAEPQEAAYPQLTPEKKAKLVQKVNAETAPRPERVGGVPAKRSWGVFQKNTEPVLGPGVLPVSFVPLPRKAMPGKAEGIAPEKAPGNAGVEGRRLLFTSGLTMYEFQKGLASAGLPGSCITIKDAMKLFGMEDGKVGFLAIKGDEYAFEIKDGRLNAYGGREEDGAGEKRKRGRPRNAGRPANAAEAQKTTEDMLDMLKGRRHTGYAATEEQIQKVYMAIANSAPMKEGAMPFKGDKAFEGYLRKMAKALANRGYGPLLAESPSAADAAGKYMAEEFGLLRSLGATDVAILRGGHVVPHEKYQDIAGLFESDPRTQGNVRTALTKILYGTYGSAAEAHKTLIECHDEAARLFGSDPATSSRVKSIAGQMFKRNAKPALLLFETDPTMEGLSKGLRRAGLAPSSISNDGAAKLLKMEEGASCFLAIKGKEHSFEMKGGKLRMYGESGEKKRVDAIRKDAERVFRPSAYPENYSQLVKATMGLIIGGNIESAEAAEIFYKECLEKAARACAGYPNAGGLAQKLAYTYFITGKRAGTAREEATEGGTKQTAKPMAGQDEKEWMKEKLAEELESPRPGLKSGMHGLLQSVEIKLLQGFLADFAKGYGPTRRNSGDGVFCEYLDNMAAVISRKGYTQKMLEEKPALAEAILDYVKDEYTSFRALGLTNSIIKARGHMFSASYAGEVSRECASAFGADPETESLANAAMKMVLGRQSRDVRTPQDAMEHYRECRKDAKLEFGAYPNADELVDFVAPGVFTRHFESAKKMKGLYENYLKLAKEAVGPDAGEAAERLASRYFRWTKYGESPWVTAEDMRKNYLNGLADTPFMKIKQPSIGDWSEKGIMEAYRPKIEVELREAAKQMVARRGALQADDIVQEAWLSVREYIFQKGEDGLRRIGEQGKEYRKAESAAIWNAVHGKMQDAAGWIALEGRKAPVSVDSRGKNKDGQVKEMGKFAERESESAGEGSSEWLADAEKIERVRKAYKTILGNVVEYFKAEGRLMDRDPSGWEGIENKVAALIQKEMKGKPLEALLSDEQLPRMINKVTDMVKQEIYAAGLEPKP